MKYIILILVLAISTQASAQFSTTTQARTYIDRYIRNSAVDAFTNLRLNTALKGTLNLLDGLDGGSAGTLVDTIYRLNSTTLRFRIKRNGLSFFYDITAPSSGGGGGSTDLGYSVSPTAVTISSSTGTSAIIPTVTSTNAGMATPLMKKQSDSMVNGTLTTSVPVSADFNVFGGGLYMKKATTVASGDTGVVTNDAIYTALVAKLSKNITTSTTINLSAAASLYIIGDATKGFLEVNHDYVQFGFSNGYIRGDGTIFTFYDGRITPIGIEYGADYSTLGTNNTLIQKGYLLTGVATIANKRITPRVATTTTGTTITPTGDASDIYTVTALAANASFAAPTGTPTDGQSLLIRITSDASIRTLSWNAIYRAGTDIALPTATVASKTMYVQFIYNAAATKWDFTGLTQGF